MSCLTHPSLTGLLSERQLLVETCTRLGQCRRDGKREEFEETLRALDMTTEEAGLYWDALPDSSVNDTSWQNARNNTELAGSFGILLNNEDHPVPRNLFLYRLVQRHFPDILQVRVTGQRHMGGAAGKKNPPEKRLVIFDTFPMLPSGSPMAVHSFVQGQEPAQFTDSFLGAAAPLREFLGEGVGLDLASLLVNTKMLLPPRRMAQLLSDVIKRGLRGETVMVVGAFCPDYAYEKTGNPHIPYRYTFDGLGEGVGLVAQQFVRIVPVISEFLQKIGVNHHIVLGIGDFEADSEAVLERVGLTRAEFIRRCQGSLDAFRAMVPTDLPLTLELFAESRGKGRFRPYAEAATARMLVGDFGCMAELYEDLVDIIARIPSQYRTFYERWYGHPMDNDEVNGIVYAQGGEYSAMARIYQEDCGPNVLVLAGDRPEMHRFNALYQMQPVLCAKRAY